VLGERLVAGCTSGSRSIKRILLLFYFGIFFWEFGFEIVKAVILHR
jgi:hypothetical protein